MPSNTTQQAGHEVRIVRVQTDEQHTVSIPIHVIRGAQPGPTLLAIAGEHGIEINGMVAVDRLVQHLDPATMRGTVLAIPIANPPNLAYRHHTKDQPRGKGYTREMPWNTYFRWPGDPSGSPAERICAALHKEVFDPADVIVNIHGWSWHSSSSTLVSPEHRRSRELAKAFGLTFIALVKDYDRPPRPDGDTLVHQALAADKPAFLVELNTMHWIDPVSSAAGFRGLINVMRAMGILEGEPELPEAQYESPGGVDVRAPRPGLWVPLVRRETAVSKDQPLGYLLDPESGKREHLLSPIDGVTWLVDRIGRAQDLEIQDMHSYANANDILVMVRNVERV